MNSSSDTNEQRISELVTAYRILLNEQVLDSFGHVSVRSATDPDRFFMPRAMPPSLVTSDDVLEYRVTDSQPADRSTRSARERRALSARRNRRLILPAPLDVLIDEGAKAIVVMGVPVAARRGLQRRRLRHPAAIRTLPGSRLCVHSSGTRRASCLRSLGALYQHNNRRAAYSDLMFASRMTRPYSSYCLRMRASNSAPHMESTG